MTPTHEQPTNPDTSREPSAPSVTRTPHRHVAPLRWWIRRTLFIPAACFIFLAGRLFPTEDNTWTRALINVVGAYAAALVYGFLTWCVAALATPKVVHD